jgi:hypothetical protein
MSAAHSQRDCPDESRARLRLRGGRSGSDVDDADVLMKMLKSGGNANGDMGPR